MLSKLTRPIDWILNSITMYRLVLYHLIALVVGAFLFSCFRFINLNPFLLLISCAYLIAVCYLTNNLFSYVFSAPTNVESVYITALILTLVVTPATNLNELIFLTWAGVLAIASKYILAINKKHIFNPVAISVLLTAFVINHSASWWVGNTYLAPIVIVGGILIVKKLQKADMLIVFICAAFSTVTLVSILNGSNILDIYQKVILHSSLLFFAFIMLTEPLTTPPTYTLQLIYAAIVGVLFAPQIHIGTLYSTPEIALVIGNIFSYIVSPKVKLILTLKEKIQLAPDIYDFIFAIPTKISFKPGQYMEWTLPHKNTDSRGNRRYFTLASSPTENNLRIGVKFYDSPSSYKKQMLDMKENKIVAGQIAGDFTLPSDKTQKLVFLAGGIGVTPYRSIIKDLIDRSEKRDLVLVYSNKVASEIVYKDVFDDAINKIGLRTLYVLTDTTNVPINWQGLSGRITSETIIKYIPDYKDRLFYLSGPRSMVTHYEDVLESIGVYKRNIKTDFFPGLV